MRLSNITSYCIIGVEAQPISIEVHISNGLPGLSVVGLPEAAVRESKDRVRSAILNSQFEFPARRITVNLAPADIPKNGAGFDLPIAIGILHASGQLECENIGNYALIGELSLSGNIRAVKGLIPVALAADTAEKQLVAPLSNRGELDLLSASNHVLAPTLADVCGHLNGSFPIESVAKSPQLNPPSGPCLSEVRGQTQAKRALEIAAAGGHSLLMMGPPGTGKTMLAERLPGILPEISDESALEVASIYSVAGLERGHFHQPPYRAPHHTASPAALVGGGTRPIPGEISLSHRGVLFLDELPEFPSKVLEVLRQPLESGEIWVSRAAMKSVFPANFQLVAAMNPCKCGYLGQARCKCTPDQVRQYQNRISGPLLDRIDLQIQVSQPDKSTFFERSIEETNATVQARIIAAREIQNQRQDTTNASITVKELENILNEDGELKGMAMTASERMNLSARALHRALRVARTIADMDGAEKVQVPHLSEALGYRHKMNH